LKYENTRRKKNKVEEEKGIPNKIKVFAWRASNNILPSKTRLFDKGILPSYTCDLCGEGPETLIHASWECSSARLVWDQLEFFNTLPIQACKDWKVLLDRFLIRKANFPKSKSPKS
jgi:hypothetical protein